MSKNARWKLRDQNLTFHSYDWPIVQALRYIGYISIFYGVQAIITWPIQKSDFQVPSEMKPAAAYVLV